MKTLTESRVPEAATLASMLLKPKIIPSILEVITDERDFFFPEHETIFLIIFQKFLAGEAIDGALIRDELDRRGKLAEIGGFEYLRDMLETVPSAANGVYYAKAVREHKRQRDILKAVDEIQQIDNGDVDEQIEKIQSIANSLTAAKRNDSYCFKDAVDRVIAESKKDKPCLQTGFRDLDYYIGGFRPGELIILAARPAIGKSALALGMSLNIAKLDKHVLFFSFEMSYQAIIERALLSWDGSELKRFDIAINETCSSIDRLIAFVKGRQRFSKIDLVVVDYLQLMSDGKKDNRCQEISNISRKLKLLAMSENIPILALSQLNRTVESRQNHRPYLADLRESGSIEQDADVVMLLTRDDVYRQQENSKAVIDGLAELIIAKNRSGKTGVASLVFLDCKVTFANKTNSEENNF